MKMYACIRRFDHFLSFIKSRVLLDQVSKNEEATDELAPKPSRHVSIEYEPPVKCGLIIIIIIILWLYFLASIPLLLVLFLLFHDGLPWC